MNINDFLKTDEVSKKTGISQHTLRRMALNGKVPAYKIRGLWVFNPHDIDDLFRPNTLARGQNGGKKELGKNDF